MRSPLPALACLLAALVLSPPAAAVPTYRKGEAITFSGRVTGGDGQGLAGVTVLLELTHSKFSVWSMKTKTRGPVVIPTLTDEDGHFQVEWGYDAYFNVFELAVALPVRRSGAEDFEVFLRLDVSSRLEASEAVIDVPLVIERPGYLLWLQSYLAGEASEDEQKVFREMGRPDRLDRDARRDRFETAWWYFELGKVYRFEDGELDQVIPFEPVAPPPP